MRLPRTEGVLKFVEALWQIFEMKGRVIDYGNHCGVRGAGASNPG